MNRSKNFIKTFVFAFAFLLTLALTLGITGAWYNTRRQADGVITMSDGIVIEYSGFGQGSGEWQNNSADFLLFATNNEAGPGTTATLNEAGIKAGSGSADFFVRAKLEYKFFTDVEGLTEVTSQIADYSAFVNTPTFAQGWVDSGLGDGWFYYATGSTFNTLPSADYVNVFTPGQSITLNGAAEGFNHQGGGYKYSDEILIKRVTVVLTLEAYQANQTAAANAGWEIHVPEVVENSNSQVVEIYSNEITLGNVGGAYKLGTGEAGSLAYDTTTLGTTLKIIVAGDSQINANAFENSDLENVYIGDADYINGVSGYSAKVYNSPATFIIGANAFAGCTNLTLHLASGVNYTIYTNAIPSSATVYYDNNTISLPTSAGAVAGTGITMATPSIVTGGSGAGTVNYVSGNIPEDNNYYIYTDNQGTEWYFDLGKLRIDDENWLLDNSPWDHYNSSKLEARIYGCGCYHSAITIPRTVQNNEITGVINVVCIASSGLNVFGESSPYGGYAPSSITIPDSIVYIGNEAFNGVPISTIDIPSSVVQIGGYAFANCSELTSITLPNSVSKIETCAFENCSQLTTINIPNSLVDMSEAVFSGCSALETFTGGSVKYSVTPDNKCLIENDGDNHTLIALSKVGLNGAYTSMPSSITGIGSNVFADCTTITSITLPISLRTIGQYAFAGCTNLTSINLGAVTSIRFNAFDGCTGLTSITIPNSVTSIEVYAFESCSGLTDVTFEGSGRIEDLIISTYAFNGCSNLATVNFNNWPAGVNVTIQDNAFANCAPGLVVNIPNQD